jgi:PAS domain S-box-containing protein
MGISMAKEKGSSGNPEDIDVTERKRMEETLQKSQEQTRRQLEEIEAIYNAAPVGLCVFDRELRYVRINERLAEMNGIPAALHLGKTVRQMIPDLADLAEHIAGQIFATGEPILNIEFSGTTQAQPGVIRTWIEHWLPLKDTSGSVVGINVVAEEITERKRAEENLIQSNQRLELLSHITGELLTSENPQEVIEDLCHRVLSVVDCQVFFNYLIDQTNNNLHLNACGGVSEEVVKTLETLDYGVAVCGCVAQDNYPIIAENITEGSDVRTNLVASMGVRAYACNPLRSQNGKVIGTLSFGTTTRTSFTSEEQSLFKTVADHVSIALERIQTQEALRENEERFRSVYEQAAVGISQLTLDGHLFQANDMVSHILGYTQEELRQKNSVEMTHSDDRAEEKRLLDQLLEGKIPSYTLEKRYLHKTGDPVWVRLTSSLAHGSAKIGTYRIAVIEDITDRKRAEEALRKTQADLALAQALAHLGSWRWDIVHNQVSWSDEMYRIYGVDPTTFSHTVEGVASLIHPEDFSRHLSAIDVLIAGKPFMPFEYRVVRPDGTIRWVQIAGANVERDARGKVVCLFGVVLDITDRKMVEEARRKSEQRFRTFFESDMVGAISWNMEGQILDANDKFLQMVGYSREDLKAGYIDWTQMTPPEYRDLDQKAIAELKTTGVDTPYEKEYIRKDGTRVPIIIGAAMIDEKRYEGIAFVLDISDRKQVEKELKESKTQLAAILDQLPVGVGLMDQEGRWLINNPILQRFCPTFMPSRDKERVSRWFAQGPNGEPLEPSQWPGARALRGETVTPGIEFRYQGEDGQNLWLSVTASPFCLEDGTRAGAIAVIQDIDHVKQTEQALRDSERKFRIMGEAIPYGVWWCNDHGGAEYVSQSFLDLLEMSMDEMKEFGWTHRLPPEDVDPMLKRWLHCVHSGCDWNDEHRIYGPDGKLHYVLTQGKPVRNEEGQIIGWVGINLDIDERKHMEEELRKAKEELEQRVQERTLELEKANIELQRSNKDLEQFAYVSSHDLQEPLRMVASFVQLLEQEYQDRLDETGREYINYAVEGAKRMQMLIKSLLAYSRVNTQGHPFASVNCNKLVEDVLRNLSLVIEESQAQISYDSLPTVWGDELQLMQVFQNLLENAIKFRKPHESPYIHLSAHHNGEKWVFSLRDNGIGIDPQFYEKIFVIFKRLHTRDKYPGTGIGLAVVKRIIERHGGHIQVESKPNEGSSFIFTFPDAKGSCEPEPELNIDSI